MTSKSAASSLCVMSLPMPPAKVSLQWMYANQVLNVLIKCQGCCIWAVFLRHDPCPFIPSTSSKEECQCHFVL